MQCLKKWLHIKLNCIDVSMADKVEHEKKTKK